MFLSVAVLVGVEENCFQGCRCFVPSRVKSVGRPTCSELWASIMSPFTGLKIAVFSLISRNRNQDANYTELIPSEGHSDDTFDC